MSNALLGQPEVTSVGDLITYHAGILDVEGSDLPGDDLVKSGAPYILRNLPQRDVTYAVNVNMIREVVKAAYNRSAFDWY